MKLLKTRKIWVYLHVTSYLMFTKSKNLTFHFPLMPNFQQSEVPFHLPVKIRFFLSGLWEHSLLLFPCLFWVIPPQVTPIGDPAFSCSFPSLYPNPTLGKGSDDPFIFKCKWLIWLGLCFLLGVSFQKKTKPLVGRMFGGGLCASMYTWWSHLQARRTFPEEAEDSETARIILVFEIHFWANQLPGHPGSRWPQWTPLASLGPFFR